MPKNLFDLQLTDLPVQNIDLCLAGRTLRRRAATLENTRRAVQQLLLPIVDLVWMDPKLTRQLGNRPVDAAQLLDYLPAESASLIAAA